MEFAYGRKVDNLQEALNVLSKFCEVSKRVWKANLELDKLAHDYGVGGVEYMRMTMAEFTIRLPYQTLKSIRFNENYGIDCVIEGYDIEVEASATSSGGTEEFTEDLESALEYFVKNVPSDDEEELEEVKQLLKELKEWN